MTTCCWCLRAPGTETCPGQRKDPLDPLCHNCHCAIRMSIPCRCMTVGEAIRDYRERTKETQDMNSFITPKGPVAEEDKFVPEEDVDQRTPEDEETEKVAAKTPSVPPPSPVKGQALVEKPRRTRSQARRVAAQKSEPAPTFEKHQNGHANGHANCVNGTSNRAAGYTAADRVEALRAELKSLEPQAVAELRDAREQHRLAIIAIDEKLAGYGQQAGVEVHKIEISSKRDVKKLPALLDRITSKPRPSAKPLKATGARLARRSAEDIANEIERVTMHLKKHGAQRAEQIRAALSLSPKEMPRILKTGLESKIWKKRGEKRATSYELRG